MRTVRSIGLTGGLAILAGSCADLPDREPDACGNGIVEPELGEDCDSTNGCISVDQPGACWWGCSDTDCPEGFVCGADEVCRAPTHSFESSTFLDGWGLVATVRDFDSDGLDELLVLHAPEGALNAEAVTLELHHFDDQRVVTPLMSQVPAGVPRFMDFDDDGRTDIQMALDPEAGSFAGLNRLASGVVFLENSDAGFGALAAAEGWGQRESQINALLPISNEVGHPVILATYDDTVHKLTLPHADDKPLLPGVTAPSLNWPTAVATTSDAWLEGMGCTEAQFTAVDLALVSGPPKYGGYAGPVLLFGLCVTKTVPHPSLDLPPGAKAFLPWVAFSNIDETPGEDLLVGLFLDQPNACAVHVAYAAPGNSFDSAPNPTDPGDSQLDPQPLIQFPCPSEDGVKSLRIRDIDDDGRPDLVSSDLVMLSECKGSCSCESAEYDCGTVLGGPPDENDVAVLGSEIGDVNGDARLDLLFGMTTFEGHGGLVEALSGADGLNWSPVLNQQPSGVDAVRTADLNGDSLTDTVIRTIGAGDQRGSLRLRWGGDPPDAFETVLEGHFQGPLMRLETGDPIGAGQLLMGVVEDPTDARTAFISLQAIGSRVGALLRPPRRPPTAFNTAPRAARLAHSWVLSYESGLHYTIASGFDGRDDSRLWIWELESKLGTILRANLQNDLLLAKEDPLRAAAMAGLSFDVDSDGDDELVLFLPKRPEQTQAPGAEFDPGCSTAFLFDDLDSDTPIISEDISNCYAPWIAQAFPVITDVGAQSTPRAFDVDGDGFLDVLVNAYPDIGSTPGLPQPMVLFNRGGTWLEDPVPIRSENADFVGVREGWTLWRDEVTNAVMGAFEGYGQLVVGELDPDTLTLDIEWETELATPSAELTAMMSAGDLDHDGITDLVVPTGAGFEIFWGLDSHD